MSIKGLKGIEFDFWESYLNTLDFKPMSPMVTSGMAGNAKLADELLELYLKGNKTAGSGLLRAYLIEDEDIPIVGNYWIILDSKSNPRCIVQTVRVEINRFDEVPESVAIAEGEGDLSISYWRKVHREFFIPFLKTWGISNLDEELVVTEHFKLLYS